MSSAPDGGGLSPCEGCDMYYPPGELETVSHPWKDREPRYCSACREAKDSGGDGPRSGGSSRPSQTNCADSRNGGVESCNGGSVSAGNGGGSETGGEVAEDRNCADISADEDRDVGAAIRGIVEECEAEHGTLAARALSVVPGHKVRKEVTREVRSSGGSYQSKTVLGALKAFLRWFSDQEGMQLVGRDLESGDEVLWPAVNSFDEEYLAEKYGTIKDAEWALVEDGEDPHTAMLTPSGSNLNKHGKPRCPGDHLVDLKASYDRFVRRELQRVMDGLGFERYDPDDPPERWWEYAVVAEPHKSGYIHLHIAVFTSHEVSQSDFAPVMEKHVEKCEMAGTDAHRNEPCDQHKGSAENVWDSAEGSCEDCHNPVSVRDVEKGVDNLGSYIAAYMGPSGSELWDLPVSQLIAFATIWATGQRRIHFSQGFNEAAEKGREMRSSDDDDEKENEGRIVELEGMRTSDGEDHALHDRKECEGCERVYKQDCGGVCPNCGGELKSATSQYMREIRGRTRGDPPPIRD